MLTILTEHVKIYGIFCIILADFIEKGLTPSLWDDVLRRSRLCNPRGVREVSDVLSIVRKRVQSKSTKQTLPLLHQTRLAHVERCQVIPFGIVVDIQQSVAAIV